MGMTPVIYFHFYDSIFMNIDGYVLYRVNESAPAIEKYDEMMKHIAKYAISSIHV